MTCFVFRTVYKNVAMVIAGYFDETCKEQSICLEEEYRYSSTLSLTSALDGGGWSTPCPGRSTPRKESRYPTVQEPGCAPGHKISSPPLEMHM